jgi:Mor family transcriptional regulator
MKLPGALGEIASIAGIPAALAIAERLGGQFVYIQRADSILRNDRNEKIRNDHKTGLTIEVIAIRYGLSKRQIINILDVEDE